MSTQFQEAPPLAQCVCHLLVLVKQTKTMTVNCTTMFKKKFSACVNAFLFGQQYEESNCKANLTLATGVRVYSPLMRIIWRMFVSVAGWPHYDAVHPKNTLRL